MKNHYPCAAMLGAGLLLAAPAFAQTTPQKQPTDGNSPTMVGAGGAASKQRTDGSSPPMVGPASKAYKQRTQSLSHSDGSPEGVAKQD